MNAFSADISYDRLLSPSVLLFGDDPARRAMLAERIAEQAAGWWRMNRSAGRWPGSSGR